MPLSEFLRMARGKLEAGQQKQCLIDLSSRPENDMVELVWENGQIVMQGQSSRVTRYPTQNNLPSNTSRVRDVEVGHATNARFGKFVGVESILNDMAPVVPSADLDLSQDDERIPWLNYPIDDALAQDYVSELLPEISGVTANGISNQNSSVSVNKSSSEQTLSNLHGGGGTLKASSSFSSKDHLLCSWSARHCQTSDALGSGASDIVNKNTSNILDATFGNLAQGGDVENGSASVKMDRQTIWPPANNSDFLNFSHFSRPANRVKANLLNSDGTAASVSSGVGRMEIKEKGSAASGSNPVKSTLCQRFNSTPEEDIDFHGLSAAFATVNSREPVVNTLNGSCPPERTEDLCQETSIKNDKPLIPNNTENLAKGVPDGERTIEPLVASSSVGSENSADRVSCEQKHNSKRKFRDIEESECRSDDVETESLVIKKPTPVRGSKRSRAAEVHNLSERRRRDRINEKMRALQELIPNCNKADKASMLDEAIEYLKTLQLQVQVMSMGAGLCMPPMMFPTGMRHMHPAHVPHFPPMGVGMSAGMGFGMGMLDLNGGSSGRPIYPVPPLQVAQFPSPVLGLINFQRTPVPNLPVFGHPGQGISNSVPRAPFVPLTGPTPVTSTMGLSDLRNGINSEVTCTPTILNPRNPIATANPQSICNAETGRWINDNSNQMQATKEVLDQSLAVQENEQHTDVRDPAALASATTDISKEPGCD